MIHTLIRTRRDALREGRRAGIIDGVALGIILGLILGFGVSALVPPWEWFGPQQYVRGEMYRGGGIAVDPATH